jgi:hypothetical protein
MVMLMLRGLRQIEYESAVVLLSTCLRPARCQPAGRGVSCGIRLGCAAHRWAKTFLSPVEGVAPAIKNPRAKVVKGWTAAS